jgi:kynurenine formamidase
LNRRPIATILRVIPSKYREAGGSIMSLKSALAVPLLLLALPALAQAPASPSWSPPAESARCPSKWGAGDERGAANHMKPETVLNAMRLVKTGEVIELGQTLNSSMPLFGTRRFDVHTKRTFMNPQSNQRGSNEEVITTEIGQVGTQLDGFTHQTHGNSLYNCFKVDEIATRSGFKKLGIEKVGAIITRGVMIDVAGAKGVDMLDDTYEITVEDLEAALKRQNLALRPGDAILIHTGRGKLWGKDNARYNKSAPGIGIKAAEFLIARDPILIGSDTFPVEVFPNPDPNISAPVHQIALVVNGVFLLENVKLDEMAAKNIGEFAFMMQPLKIEGGTGSTVAPVAVR